MHTHCMTLYLIPLQVEVIIYLYNLLSEVVMERIIIIIIIIFCVYKFVLQTSYYIIKIL